MYLIKLLLNKHYVDSWSSWYWTDEVVFRQYRTVGIKIKPYNLYGVIIRLNLPHCYAH